MTASAYQKKPDGNKTRPAQTPEELAERGLKMNPKQIRARARRASARGRRIDAEVGALYKPIEEWDDEELAEGAPRELWGTSTAAKLSFMPRQLHEEVIGKYQEVVKGKMREMTLPALRTLTAIMESKAVDRRGRPVVSAAVKVDVAKFLLEHVVGKPTQKVEGELSVRLQGVLAHVMAVPGQLADTDEPPTQLSGFQGLELVQSTEDTSPAQQIAAEDETADESDELLDLEEID